MVEPHVMVSCMRVLLTATNCGCKFRERIQFRLQYQWVHAWNSVRWLAKVTTNKGIESIFGLLSRSHWTHSVRWWNVGLHYNLVDLSTDASVPKEGIWYEELNMWRLRMQWLTKPCQLLPIIPIARPSRLQLTTKGATFKQLLNIHYGSLRGIYAFTWHRNGKMGVKKYDFHLLHLENRPFS